MGVSKVLPTLHSLYMYNTVRCTSCFVEHLVWAGLNDSQSKLHTTNHSNHGEPDLHHQITEGVS